MKKWVMLAVIGVLVVAVIVLITTGLRFGTGISLGSMTAKYGECNIAECYGFIYNHNCIGFLGGHTLLGCISPGQADCLKIDLNINKATYDNATKALNLIVSRNDRETNVNMTGVKIYVDGIDKTNVAVPDTKSPITPLDTKSFIINLDKKPSNVKVAAIMGGEEICSSTARLQSIE